MCAKNSAVNLDITNNSDGFDLTGGTTRRKMTFSGADMAVVGAGSTVITFPSTTDTVLGRASADTITGKKTFNTGTGGATINLAAGSAPTVPSEGDMWADSTQKAIAMQVDGMTQFGPGVLLTQTNTVTVTNTVSELTILGTGIGTKTCPANFPAIGKTVRIKMGGIYTTPIGAPSIIIKVKYGATTIATVTTTALGSGATNLLWNGEVELTFRTIGATGTVMTHGSVEYQTGVAGTLAMDSLNNAGATTTVDTTVSSALNITVQWDTNTSTRSVSSTVCTIEALN